jgi:hypothetical protein
MTDETDIPDPVEEEPQLPAPVVDPRRVLVSPELFDRRVMTLKPELRRELGIKLNPLVVMEQMLVAGMLDVSQVIDVCKHMSKFTHSSAAIRAAKNKGGGKGPEDWVRALENQGMTFDNDTGEIYEGDG